SCPFQHGPALRWRPCPIPGLAPRLAAHCCAQAAPRWFPVGWRPSVPVRAHAANRPSPTTADIGLSGSTAPGRSAAVACSRKTARQNRAVWLAQVVEGVVTGVGGHFSQLFFDAEQL